MKSLQNQYNLIKEGKGNKDVFIKSAKTQFPDIPNHYGFNETVNELKYRNILNEGMLGIVSAQPTVPDWFKLFNESINEAKAEEKKPTKEVVDMETRGFDYKDKKNIDNVYGEQFLKGFYTEMQDPKNEEKTVEELKSIVAKNLAKDQLHYVKDGQFGVKGVGYTTEAPGLGTPKEAKGKYKSSGYGNLNESSKNKQYYKNIAYLDKTGLAKKQFSDEDIQTAKKMLSNGEFNLNENTLTDIENQLLDANIGDMAYGGGYGPFEKVSRNTWTNVNTNSLSNSESLASFIGGFNDFRIESSKENKPKIDKLLNIINTKKAGPEYKKALMDLIAMAEEKSGKTINTKKEALLALDYIEPTINENQIRKAIRLIIKEELNKI